MPSIASRDIREKEKKRAAEVVRIKLTAEAKLLMVKGEQCSADNDWHEVRLAWKEARRATEALVLPGETAGVLMYEECVYHIALCYKGEELSGTYMTELRQLEASAQMVSTKRRVKARITEALGPEEDEEAFRLAMELKRLRKPRGVADSAYRTCMKILCRAGGH